MILERILTIFAVILILEPVFAYDEALNCVGDALPIDKAYLSSDFLAITVTQLLHENPSKISNETLSLDCDPARIAKKITEQKERVVPSRLHHFGQRRYLTENIQTRTVPKSSWDQSIMSPQSRFGHGLIRQGIYATAGIDSNGFGGGVFGFRNNWMIEIVIDDSCRTPEAVATLNILSQDTRFQSWFASLKSDSREGFADLREYQLKCDGQMSMTGFLETRCDHLVDRFLIDAKIRVIQDHQMRKSFYLRDRSCIKSILGSADEMANLLAYRDFWWMNPCGSDLASEYIPYYLALSLKETTKPVHHSILDKIDRNIDLMANKDLRSQVRNLLNTYRRCLHAGKLEVFRQQINEDEIRSTQPGSFKWKEPEKYCQ